MYFGFDPDLDCVAPQACPVLAAEMKMAIIPVLV